MKTLILLLVVMSLTCTAFASGWEKFDTGWDSPRIRRMKVPHGWLVEIGSEAICYVPDENHQWRVE